MTLTSIIAIAILLTAVPYLIALVFWFLDGRDMSFLRVYRNVWLVLLIAATAIAFAYVFVFVVEAAASGTWGFEKS